MKTLWNMISFLAVVNLLAIAMVIAWLWQSERLDRSRIEAVRDIFAPTLTEQADRDFDDRVAQERQAELAAQESDRLDPPMSTTAILQQKTRLGEMERQTRARINAESDQLLANLEMQRRAFEVEKQGLEDDREAWEQDIEAERIRKQDEQFQQAVKLYESLPAKQAKRMLLNLVESGAMDQAVTYLDAMANRPAAGILKELKTDVESRVATELLERLRTHGLGAVARDATNAEPALNPASADANAAPGVQTP